MQLLFYFVAGTPETTDYYIRYWLMMNREERLYIQCDAPAVIMSWCSLWSRRRSSIVISGQKPQHAHSLRVVSFYFSFARLTCLFCLIILFVWSSVLASCNLIIPSAAFRLRPFVRPTMARHHSSRHSVLSFLDPERHAVRTLCNNF